MPTAPGDHCLHELFAEQVRTRPDAPALVDATTALTYAELDRRAERLATCLRAAGVGRDELVGVLMERRAEYVIACLAALKAGGSFLVLELAYPPELLAEVMDDARPRVVVTLAAHAGRLEPGQPRIVLDGDDGGVLDARRVVAADLGDRRPSPESLAFVSYSSGTTGRPKGIANPHRAAVRSYLWRFGVSDQRPGDRVACNVFFIWEMLRPLLRGATTYVIGDDVIYDPVALVAFLRDHRITETLMTPSLLETVLARVGSTLATQLPDLRVLWLNGEIVTRTLAVRVLAALPSVRVLNVYSASETHEIAAGDLRDLIDLETTYCAVGRPLDSRHTYVLDPDGESVAPGSEGELYVGGDCLAREYLNLPDRTAAAFVADPHATSPGARMYRTGDRARFVGDGVLEVTGRVGSMVKIRGYSIEPGAVEAALEQTLAIRAGAVVAAGDEGGDKRLVAYVVRESATSAIGDRARDWAIDRSGHSPGARRALGERLPHYMVPAVFVEVDVLPVHSSGKVDLERLPPPPAPAARAAVADADAVPSSLQALAEVWATVLDMVPGDIGPAEDFFDLGGHSLAVAELAAALADTFGVDVPLADLVARPTLLGHRDIVRAARRGGATAVVVDGADLRREATLDATVRPGIADGRAGVADARDILLTGATGFLGGFLLDALARTTQARLLCLVRAPAMDDRSGAAMRRLRVSLEERGLWRPDVADRVTVVAGDLQVPRLGLSGSAFDALAAEVDTIVHAGAHVNLMYPYAALRDVNVGGTREVLRLATHRGAATPVHHVSTSGVLPPSPSRWREDAPLDEAADDVAGGYGQSKWVAEQLVHTAAERGLPVRIYRPGTLSGHSVSGIANPDDLLGAIISESLHLGYAPDVDGWDIEMTPVDHVSDAIAALATDDRAAGPVFHLADPDPLPAQALFDRFARLGYPTRRVGWDDWVRRWRHERSDATAAPAAVLRGGMPSAEELLGATILDDALTRADLERHGLRRPGLDDDVLSVYARYFRARGWLATPPVGLRVGVA